MKEDKLKKLIQTVDLDQPKADFTESVMKEIQLQESLVINTALQSVLEEHIIESPSIDFTQKVMLSVERSDKKVVYKPIISKKVWYGVGIAASLIITLISIFGKSAQTSNTPLPLATPINQVTGKIIQKINALPTLVLACLFAVSALVLIEYFLSNRKKYQV